MKSCYTEEDINRYIDGELNPGEVERMKEHLKGCGGCAAVFESLRDIGGILRTYRALELASAAEEDGLIQVPEHLDRKIKEEHLIFPPILLGRIEVKLTELEEASARRPDSSCRMVYPLEQSSGEIKMAAEEQALFEFKSKSTIEEESGDEFTMGKDQSPGFEKPASLRGLRWSFDRGEINVVIEMRREETGDLLCLIHLTDCYGFPLAGVPLRLEKAGKQIWSHQTELKKDAVFPGMTGGNYRLTISHDRDYFLDMNLQ